MRVKNIVKGLLDTTGLDWLPVVVSDRFYTPYVQEHAQENQEITESFEAHQTKLKIKQITDVIQELSKLKTDEDNRQEKIEAKALSLISFTGLSSAFVAGLVTVLGSAQYSEVLRQRVVIVYSLLLLSLFVTVVLAIKAIRVGKFSFMFPHITNFWEREDMTDIEYYRDQARDLLRSYIHNRGIVNDKASFVAGAQDWFRNTIMLLMLMIAFIVFTPSQTSSTGADSCTATPTPVYTATYTATPPLTPTPTSTLTSPLTGTPTP